MGNQPFWLDNTDVSWDLIVIAGLDFVGFATITGGVSRDIQVKKPKGADGATLTDNGYKPAQISVTLKMVQEVDWDGFQNELLPLIHPRRKGGARTPVIVTQPALNVLGISRVYFHTIGMPVIGKDKIGTVQLKAIEWFPAPRPVKKAAGVTIGTLPNAGPAAGPAGNPIQSTVQLFDSPSEFALEGIGE